MTLRFTWTLRLQRALNEHLDPSTADNPISFAAFRSTVCDLFPASCVSRWRRCAFDRMAERAVKKKPDSASCKNVERSETPVGRLSIIWETGEQPRHLLALSGAPPTIPQPDVRVA